MFLVLGCGFFYLFGLTIHKQNMLQNSYGQVELASCLVLNTTINYNSINVQWEVSSSLNQTTITNSTYYSNIFRYEDTYNCWITNCFWNHDLPICTNNYNGFDPYFVYPSFPYDDNSDELVALRNILLSVTFLLGLLFTFSAVIQFPFVIRKCNDYCAKLVKN